MKENKDKSWKIVKCNSVNSDQELIAFYNSEQHAKENIPYIMRKYGNWISNKDEIIVKPVNPEKIFMPVCTDYMHYVWSMIPKIDRERVMNSDSSAEIDSNDLMCGGATYYYLSRMIPKHFTVIDIGASYGAQSYLFQEHAKYIAVEPFMRKYSDYNFENFKADGTDRFEVTAKEFVDNILPALNLDLNKTFAIVNYVPDWYHEKASELVRNTFPNCYSFYPA